MAQSVKLSDDVMTHIRSAAARQSRSVAGQITHWVNIGRAIERSSRFDYAHIADVLEGRLSPDALAAEEQEVWFDQFTQAMTEPSEQELAFYAKRQTLGQGVGLSETGDLVYTKPNST